MRAPVLTPHPGIDVRTFERALAADRGRLGRAKPGRLGRAEQEGAGRRVKPGAEQLRRQPACARLE